MTTSEGMAVTNLRAAPMARLDRATRWIAAAILVAIVASVAPWGSVGRLIVAIMFPIAVLALARQQATQDPAGWVVGAAIGYVVASGLHVLLTSPSVAWAVDGHMVPWLPIPGPTARIALAWAGTLGWAALVAIAASGILERRGRRAGTVLIGLTGVLPLLNPDGFPVDGYLLLWNRSTFTHPTFTIALVALLAATAVLHPRASPDDGGHPNQPHVVCG